MSAAVKRIHSRPGFGVRARRTVLSGVPGCEGSAEHLRRPLPPPRCGQRDSPTRVRQRTDRTTGPRPSSDVRRGFHIANRLRTNVGCLNGRRLAVAAATLAVLLGVLIAPRAAGRGGGGVRGPLPGTGLRLRRGDGLRGPGDLGREPLPDGPQLHELRQLHACPGRRVAAVAADGQRQPLGRQRAREGAHRRRAGHRRGGAVGGRHHAWPRTRWATSASSTSWGPTTSR